jgi:hypothetical protein
VTTGTTRTVPENQNLRGGVADCVTNSTKMLFNDNWCRSEILAFDACTSLTSVPMKTNRAKF